jgi:hypothetical protein
MRLEEVVGAQEITSPPLPSRDQACRQASRKMRIPSIHFVTHGREPLGTHCVLAA